MPSQGSPKYLQLVLMLQQSRVGITLNDIREEFGCSYRTAQRMLAAVQPHIPLDQWIETEVWRDRKRWRIDKQPLKLLLDLNAGELSALGEAIRFLRQNHQERTASTLASLETKVLNLTIAKEDAEQEINTKSGAKPGIFCSRLAKHERDAELLAEARGFAMRPGPRLPTDAKQLNALESAIAGNHVIRFSYHDVGAREPGTVIACPFGLLVGRFHYLVAFPDNRPESMTIYRLDRLRIIKILDKTFERPISPTMQEITARSFGVDRDEPRRVVWRFSRKAAEEAARFKFHTSQKTTKRSDGKLTVAFFAGGIREMCWELFQWAGEVEIVEPKELKEEFERQLQLARGCLGT
jgi:predicted DNA-binding transcriptional regulator YafY